MEEARRLLGSRQSSRPVCRHRGRTRCLRRIPREESRKQRGSRRSRCRAEVARCARSSAGDMSLHATVGLSLSRPDGWLDRFYITELRCSSISLLPNSLAISRRWCRVPTPDYLRERVDDASFLVATTRHGFVILKNKKGSVPWYRLRPAGAERAAAGLTNRSHQCQSPLPKSSSRGTAQMSSPAGSRGANVLSRRWQTSRPKTSSRVPRGPDRFCDVYGPSGRLINHAGSASVRSLSRTRTP
jgi:hypothetical protein